MYIAKAVAAALGLTVTSLTAALSDDVWDVSDTGQVLATVIAAVASVYAVWRVPNRPYSQPPAE